MAWAHSFLFCVARLPIPPAWHAAGHYSGSTALVAMTTALMQLTALPYPTCFACKTLACVLCALSRIVFCPSRAAAPASSRARLRQLARRGRRELSRRPRGACCRPSRPRARQRLLKRRRQRAQHQRLVGAHAARGGHAVSAAGGMSDIGPNQIGRARRTCSARWAPAAPRSSPAARPAHTPGAPLRRAKPGQPKYRS